MKHLQATFGSWRLMDLTADDMEQYLRVRLKNHARVRTKDGFRELGILKATTVHQEFRVLRRALNVAVRKKFLPANPCAGVEFPVSIRGLFRPHYVTWSEQQTIEFHAPEHLRNIIRIITETGLRVYKELMPMKKDQVDLANAMVWIPDSRRPTVWRKYHSRRSRCKHFKTSSKSLAPAATYFRATKINRDIRKP
jgi:site-specific recombinase XerC